MTQSIISVETRLGPRQQRFVDEYLTDLNGTRAAIAAGYTKNTASQAAWEVLRNPKVAAEISRRQRLRAERLEVTGGNVVSELAKLGFANISDFYRVTKNGRLELDTAALADPVKAAAISQIEITEGADGKQVIKIKLADKRAALSDLGRFLGLSRDRAEVTIVAPLSEESPEDTRRLALAVLTLLSEAHYAGQPEPMTIEAQPSTRRAADAVDDFDLDF